MMNRGNPATMQIHADFTGVVAFQPTDSFIQKHHNVIRKVYSYAFSSREDAFSWNEAYEACETLCILGWESCIFEELSLYSQQYIKTLVETRVFSEPQPSFHWNYAPTRDETNQETVKYACSIIQQALSVWSDVKEVTRIVSLVFAELDKQYVMNREVGSLSNMIRDYLTTEMKTHEYYVLAMRKAVEVVLNSVRVSFFSGTSSDESLLSLFQSIMEMILDLNLYSEYFEEYLISTSQIFYEVQSRTLFLKNPEERATRFIDLVHHCYQRETEILDKFLPESRVLPFQKTILEQFYTRNVQTILIDPVPYLDMSLGIYGLIVKNRISYLKRLHNLCHLSSSLQFLSNCWYVCILTEGCRLLQKRIDTFTIKTRVHVKASGSTPPLGNFFSSNVASLFCLEIFKNESDASLHNKEKGLLIQELLDFKDFLRQICQNAFNDETLFRDTMKNAWGKILNENDKISGLLSFLLVKYCDETLRGTSKSMSVCADHSDENNKMLERIEKILELFNLLDAKDCFQIFYCKEMSKRLLLGRRSFSLDYEELIIAKLRYECGPGFTSKMERMLKELELSRNIFIQFKNDPDSQRILENTNIQLNCNVVHADIWPITSVINATREPVLPPCIEKLHKTYFDFYSQLERGRKIKWLVSMGTAVVSALFGKNLLNPSSKKLLVVTQVQSLCLLLFNDSAHLTVKQMSDLSGIDVETVNRHVLALYLNPSKRILLKTPATTKGIYTDSYQVNTAFNSRNNRIIIGTVQPLNQETKEIDNIAQNVKDDWTHHLDAMVVRIMKRKKELPYNELIREVMDSTLFPSTKSVIKSRIETLKDREFLKESKESRILMYVP